MKIIIEINHDHAAESMHVEMTVEGKPKYRSERLTAEALIELVNSNLHLISKLTASSDQFTKIEHKRQ